MSRIGKQPIPIPANVKVERANGVVTVQGPKGKLSQKIHDEITSEFKDGQMHFYRPSDSKYHRALHGLYRALVANMIKGVSQGFSRDLEIEGVGYKVEQTGKAFTFSLGYSHSIVILPPAGIEIKVLAPNKFSISGVNKQLVGQVAAKIRSFREPEPYKGKGIRYAGEHIRRKAGKTAGA
ncbi:MAG: 50S ribosomal protein L6 [candidate division Zixibacteria bacterium RBG_16_53_22]|nr:MAG: 50S ribosomal protein L6 [candidate division Zixibacteria bacterium RBG_16_53_22]